MKPVFYFIIFIIFAYGITFAQDDSDLLEDDINLPKQTLIQEVLDALLKNPIDLNIATYDDIIKIPYLTPITANRILETRKNKTKFSSISELLSIPGIDAELLQKIRPFVSIQQPVKSNGQARIRIKLDTLTNIKGIEDYEITTRTNFNSSNPDLKFRAFIITDKDKKENNFIDFLSSSVSVTTNNNKLAIGNYLLNFSGQLLFASPFSYSSTIRNFTTTPLKSINELTGVYENNALFGIAYSQTINKFSLATFLSSTLLDADLKDDVVKKVYYYTKYTDSLSQARRNQLRTTLIGTRLTYLLNQSSLIGTSVYCNNYNKSFAPSDSGNSFYGNSLYLSGIDIQTNINNYFLLSEFAYSITNGFGFSSQIIGDWKFVKVTFNIYAQQKTFFSPHSKWKELTNRKDNLNGLFNIFYNLVGFKMYFLASTKQDFVQESLPARIQYRFERKQGKINFALSMKGNYKETILKTYGTQFNLSYPITNNLTINTRIEDRYLKALPQSGQLLSVGLNAQNRFIRTESRIYYFNITSPECKIYSYEPLRNSYAFNNRGLRFFCYLESKIKNTLKINYYLGYTKTTLDRYGLLFEMESDSDENIDSGLQISIDW